MTVVMVGGGGHAGCLMDSLVADPTIVLVGYIAPQEGPLSDLGIRYLGTDDCAPRLRQDGVDRAVLGIAGKQDNVVRRRVFETWCQAGFAFIDAIHATAVVSPRARHGSGLQCFAASVINGQSTLGDNVIVNTGAVVEHDCAVGHHVHVAPGATVCGAVTIGEETFVGAGSTILPGVTLGAGVIVAAGSVVTRDVPPATRVAGVPARILAEKLDAARGSWA